MSQWEPSARLSYWAFHTDRRPAYMRFAYLQLGSDADAENAVDATFDAIMNEWLRMLHMDRLEAYAWTVLKHRIVDQQRKRDRRPAPMDITAFEAALKEAVVDPYEVLTDTIQFYSAVSRLAERQRDAVLLRYGLHCTAGEAAAVMGVEEAIVRSHLRQAHRRLARLLDTPGSGARDGDPECAEYVDEYVVDEHVDTEHGDVGYGDPGPGEPGYGTHSEEAGS
ncbi:sigma factor-like helix-turn-helix DNA-binding protein [Streptomyces sp. NPDC002054]|uniref:RNA polymerase sigma factor n=1 Tax=Streptomyces sp. NPDC002054 TaxID=3154663 RepID=UPI00331748D6